MNSYEDYSDIRIIYIAPIKALCREKYNEWSRKFGNLRLNCMELTGDSDAEEYFKIQDCNLILATPEKWDSLTRRCMDGNFFMQGIRLVLIDEVHTIGDKTRGPTMEVVVSRMKAANAKQLGIQMRFVAVSATIPNVEDVAEWLGSVNLSSRIIKIDEEYRPVKLKKIVIGYPTQKSWSDFKFDLSLNYKLLRIYQSYADRKPALIFCSTRKSVVQAAAVLAKDGKFVSNMNQLNKLNTLSRTIQDSKLKEFIPYGIAYHHAGLHIEDRHTVEKLFLSGDLSILVSTSTLAMGVNLPAHLVIIKSTKHYAQGHYEEYSDLQILQMIGRAGRPQFDTSATAIIMTQENTKVKYHDLINDTKVIESSLHKYLTEHLNSEVILRTVTDISLATEWIRSTFLYVRAIKNPSFYGIKSSSDKDYIEKKLQGQTFSLALVNGNVTSFEKLEAFSSTDLEMIVNKHPPFGSQLKEAAKLIPRYNLQIEQIRPFSNNTAEISITITYLGKCIPEEHQQKKFSHSSLFLVGNDENKVMTRKRLIDIHHFKYGKWTRKLFLRSGSHSEEIYVNFISEHYVGIDLHECFVPKYLHNFSRSKDTVHRPLLDKKTMIPSVSQTKASEKSPCKTKGTPKKKTIDHFFNSLQDTAKTSSYLMRQSTSRISTPVIRPGGYNIPNADKKDTQEVVDCHTEIDCNKPSFTAEVEEIPEASTKHDLLEQDEEWEYLMNNFDLKSFEKDYTDFASSLNEELDLTGLEIDAKTRNHFNSICELNPSNSILVENKKANYEDSKAHKKRNSIEIQQCSTSKRSKLMTKHESFPYKERCLRRRGDEDNPNRQIEEAQKCFQQLLSSVKI